MEHRANSDVIFLMDEKFDFDVSLSPDSSMNDKDKDDVFLDTPHHVVKATPTKLVSCLEERPGGAQVRWSPLSEDQLEVVCQEAKRLANQLQRGKCPGGEDKAAAPETVSLAEADKENFIQDTAAKLNLLVTPLSMTPVKRQTFLVQDSPMKDLPPAFRERLQRVSTTPLPASSAVLATRHSTRLSTASPAGGIKTRATLRGKAGLGGVLPSKPTVPRTSSSVSQGADILKAKVQRPNKVVSSCKPSLSTNFTGRGKSCDDILSDSASVVSDISNSSLNSSVVGKNRTLVPPTKVVRKKSGIEVALLQSQKMTERRNTSSSSSSVSSFNSSISLSPSAGKMSSSMNQSLRSSTGRVAPGSVSRPVNPNKRRSSKGGATMAVARTTTSLSSTAVSSKYRKLSEPVKALRTPTQRQITPAKTTLDKTSGAATNASALIQSEQNMKRDPMALGQMAASSRKASGQGFCSPDLSKVLRPKRLMSVSCMEGLSRKLSPGPLSTPTGVSRPLQLHSQRPSGLPTPVKRQAAATPAQMLGSHARTSKPSRKQGASNFNCSPRTCPSPAPMESNGPEPVDIQPFCLEEEPPANPSEPNSPESEELPGHCPLELSKEPVPPESTTQQVLLLDLPVLTPQPVEKLLIDLSNTPDLIHKNTKTCAGTQLIDLSSPLIKWSPEDKKENSTPLINLSF
ncbi:G2 and S phase-expressed protein 1 isoform X2 [Corythoichthys intestinalis]|uniref:G2 and S phase-expressed protein 1 isoform X2 n=1 Tax=Corythoichthys intestinalis TaxID=161448 RepID=UPI0025A5C9FA|nr:G2 and S phase-expressed protein 1 isoform X2 [Corythoichthys intestinalis]